MVTIVMGVSGCGKTTVGKLLGAKLGVPFYDADDFHPESNKQLMKSGIPLTDETRRPWLETLARKIIEWNDTQGAVLACSALKESYRKLLCGNGTSSVTFLFLDGTKEQVAERLQQRTGHFMPASLLDSQFSTLEPPAEARVFKLDKTSIDIADAAAAELRSHYASV